MTSTTLHLMHLSGIKMATVSLCTVPRQTLETVTRSVNTSSGVTKVARVKIGHRPRVHEAVSAFCAVKPQNTGLVLMLKTS